MPALSLFNPGGVSEWSKEAVLKTVVPQGTVGSNPTSSEVLISWQHNCRGRDRVKGRTICLAPFIFRETVDQVDGVIMERCMTQAKATYRHLAV